MRPLMVARSCRNSTDPLPLALSTMAVASITGLVSTRPAMLMTMSHARLRNICVRVSSMRWMNRKGASSRMFCWAVEMTTSSSSANR